MSDPDAPDVGVYCRDIERYLCRVNGGHLVRIVGPAFQVVSGWHQRGVPLKLVYRGIDRRAARQPGHAGPRRPLRIDFCEADVLEVFAEWTRAVGRLAATVADEGGGPAGAEPVRGRGPSLPAHLQRAQIRLTSLVSSARLPPALVTAVDDVLSRIDAWRTEATTARGERRQQLLAALQGLDDELMASAWRAQDEAAAAALREEAAQDLAAFRGRMNTEAWENAVHAAATRLLRERLALPTLSLEP